MVAGWLRKGLHVHDDTAGAIRQGGWGSAPLTTGCGLVPEICSDISFFSPFDMRYLLATRVDRVRPPLSTGRWQGMPALMVDGVWMAADSGCG